MRSAEFRIRIKPACAPKPVPLPFLSDQLPQRRGERKRDVETQSSASITTSSPLPKEIVEFGVVADGDTDLQRLFDMAAMTVVSGLGVTSCQVYRHVSPTGELQLVSGAPGTFEDDARQSAAMALKHRAVLMPHEWLEVDP